MKKDVLKTITLSILFSLMIFKNEAKANHLGCLNVISGPIDIGGGNYQFTIQICTGTGADVVGGICTTGADGDTQNYSISVSGGTTTGIVDSGFTNTIVSGFNGVNSTGKVMNGVLYYFSPTTIYNIPLTGDSCNLYGGIVQYSWNVTFITIGIPTTITVNGIEAYGQYPGCCISYTTVSTCSIPVPPTIASATRCGKGTGTLTASGCAGTVTWYATAAGGTPLGTGSTYTSPSVSTSTNYYATCSVSSCVSSRAAGIVTVNDIPTVTVNSTTICTGVATNLTADGALTYSWSGGETANSISITPTTTTTYTITGTDNGCEGTAIAIVTVNATPTVTVNSATICNGQTVDLFALGGQAYIWSTTATMNSISVSPSTTTTYTVTGTIAGCVNTAKGIVTVNSLPSTPTISQNFAVLTSSSTTGNQWYLNGNIINGATSQTYTMLVNGNYTVEVTNGSGCAAMSAATTVTTLGIDSPTAQTEKVKVYPNPFSYSTTIEVTEVKQGMIFELYDVLGKRVMAETITKTQTTIDRNELRNGLYFYTITQDKKLINRGKLVIQ